MPEPLDPQRLFAVLERHGVDYVLIGGLAAVLYGSALVTNDADICPDRDHANLERLAAALQDLARACALHPNRKASRSRATPRCSAASDSSTSRPTAGQFDLASRPSGFAGYADLAARAEIFDIDGVHVRVAALRDIIRSKETANRLKDQAALPHLYALEDEIARLDES